MGSAILPIQVTIDKTKGIVCKPMPAYWHDARALHKSDDDDPAAMEEYEFNKRIIADKKPYFMRYIYPVLNRDYKRFEKAATVQVRLRFKLTMDEFLHRPMDVRSEEEIKMLQDYYTYMPVGIHDCTMNRICRAIEREFSKPVEIPEDVPTFDYQIMKSADPEPRNNSKYYALKKLYEEHRERMKRLTYQKNNRVVSKEMYTDYATSILTYFRRAADKICSSIPQLCDLVLDLCYTKGTSKQFAWDVIADGILANLSEKRNNVITFPQADPNGDIVYRGERFSMTSMEVDIDEYNN